MIFIGKNNFFKYNLDQKWSFTKYKNNKIYKKGWGINDKENIKMFYNNNFFASC